VRLLVFNRHVCFGVVGRGQLECRFNFGSQTSDQTRVGVVDHFAFNCPVDELSVFGFDVLDDRLAVTSILVVLADELRFFVSGMGVVTVAVGVLQISRNVHVGFGHFQVE